jgi:tetratricopeptide (TPR) repeat protein
MPSSPLSLPRSLAAAVLAVCLALPALAQNAPPPELKEVQAAMSLQEPAAKLKELERIKGAYPNSAMTQVIDGQILAARVALVATLDEVLALQKAEMETAKGAGRISVVLRFARQILFHPKAASFDKAKVQAIVQDYRDKAQKGLADQAGLAGMSERLRGMLPGSVAEMDLLLAQAQVNAGQPAKALISLDAFTKAGGPAGASYLLVRGDVLEALNRPKEAYEALLGAALENHKDGLRRAKAAYGRLNGKEDGFDAMLEARSRALPYHPAPFKPGSAWKGKAVLAELFTGSECPPCVAADFAVDGLLESFPETALVVLEYHLPIPGPDPMMNPATKKRQDYYGVNSTPTVLFDGQDKLTGGGGRSAAETKYKQLSGKVVEKVDAAPGAALKLRATRTGNRVQATLDLGEAIQGVDYQVALVQGQQEHKGGNRLLVHKMVVRDLATLDPSATTAAFDLAASEKATDAYLTEFETTSTRFKGFKFPVRRAVISREGLKVVLFAQERATKKVLQAVVADVK